MKRRQNEEERRLAGIVTRVAHYCAFEVRNLLLSEPEVHAKIFGDTHDSTQITFLLSALSFGKMCNKFYADNSPNVVINLKNYQHFNYQQV